MKTKVIRHTATEDLINEAINDISNICYLNDQETTEKLIKE